MISFRSVSREVLSVWHSVASSVTASSRWALSQLDPLVRRISSIANLVFTSINNCFGFGNPGPLQGRVVQQQPQQQPQQPQLRVILNYNRPFADRFFHQGVQQRLDNIELVIEREAQIRYPEDEFLRNEFCAVVGAVVENTRASIRELTVNVEAYSKAVLIRALQRRGPPFIQGLLTFRNYTEFLARLKGSFTSAIRGLSIRLQSVRNQNTRISFEMSADQPIFEGFQPADLKTFFELRDLFKIALLFGYINPDKLSDYDADEPSSTEDDRCFEFIAHWFIETEVKGVIDYVTPVSVMAALNSAAENFQPGCCDFEGLKQQVQDSLMEGIKTAVKRLYFPKAWALIQPDQFTHEMAVETVALCPSLGQYVPLDLIDQQKLIDEDLKTNPALFLLVIRLDVSDEQKIEFAEAFVSENPAMIEFVSNDLLTIDAHYRIIYAAIKKDYQVALPLITDTQKITAEVVGLVIEGVQEKFPDNQAGVMQTELAYLAQLMCDGRLPRGSYFGELAAIFNDSEPFMLMAVTQYGLELSQASDRLRGDRAFVRTVIETHPHQFHDALGAIKVDPELIAYATRRKAALESSI
jgi:hypothetical protein